MVRALPFISHPQYSTMLGSSGSAHSYFDSLMIDPNSGDQHKIDLGQLYCRQPYAVEIIQLVEVPAPARRFASSPIDSSSIASSSSSCYSSECESEYSSDDDDAQSAGSSYCSSDSSEQMNSEEEEEVSKPDETLDTRVTRVHAWRASFAKDMGITSSDVLPIHHTKQKRADDIDLDNGSHSSKRSRPHHAHSTSALTTHTCAACDASFSTRQILRQHGEAQANEACRIAVEYDFE